MIKILTLYHDADMRRLIGLVVQLVGYQYLSANSTEEALTWLDEGSIDLLIMEYDFPGKQGYQELYDLVKAKAELRKIGIIILWPKTDVWPEIDSCDECLIIPFPVEELIRKIDKVLENYGKTLPTVEQREQQFEQNRDQLKRDFEQTEEKLEVHRRRLFQEAGYE
jgi:DNA-binding response OmpR family regulator